MKVGYLVAGSSMEVRNLELAGLYEKKLIILVTLLLTNYRPNEDEAFL